MYKTCFRLLLCSKLNNAPYLHHVSRAGDSVFILGKHVVIDSGLLYALWLFLSGQHVHYDGTADAITCCIISVPHSALSETE